MEPFENLTESGRLRRLRRFAAEVAEAHYGMSNARVRLLSKHSFNTIFRVDHANGRSILRVGDAVRIHSAGVEDVEAQWLAHLADGSTIIAPKPIASKTGAWRVDHETDYVSGSRACSLFTFLEGRELRATRVDGAAAHAAGALLARLHDDAANALAQINEPQIEVPPALNADRVVYFHEENLLCDYRSEYGQLFRDAVDRVQQAIDELWKSPPHAPHLLHGDFGTHKVMVWRNEMRPIDFQDLQRGFDCQDLAISLADLGRSTPELAGPFTAGYESIRMLPELSPTLQATLSAGRSANMMNLGLHLRKQGINWFLERHSKLIEDWMRSA